MSASFRVDGTEQLPFTRMRSLQEARLRFGLLWPLKMLGTTGLMTAFFVAYFWVLEHPQFPVTLMPVTAFDHWIEFRPGAVLWYVSLWLYVSLAPALMRTRRELFDAAVGWFALAVVALAIFWFWPTMIPPAVTQNDQHGAFAFLKSVDASGNACPSLHVAFAVLTALWLQKELRSLGASGAAHGANWCWCAAIVYSTMAIRQHVALDVVAGAALGALVAAVHARCVKRVTKPVLVQIN